MIDKARLRQLAQLRASGTKVLSVYLNLDPKQFPTARDRQTELHSLLDRADRIGRANGELQASERKQLQAEIQRVEAYFQSQFNPKGAHGVAVFSAEPLGLFEVVRLLRQVGSEIVIDDAAFIEPLIAYPNDGGYSVLLVSRRSARIMRGGAGSMEEILSIKDDVHRWHEQGGWSQARFQRGIEKETKDHLKRAAEVVFTLFKRGQVNRLIVGAHDELYREVEQLLHPYLRDRIAGRIDLDIERASPKDVRLASATVIDQDQRGIERRWLDRLKTLVGTDGRHATGIEATLTALNERRVEALLIRSGFRLPGGFCTSCGFLAASNGSCPVDGEAMRRLDDVVEGAVEAALGQSAEVVFMRHDDELDGLGSVAAVLRY